MASIKHRKDTVLLCKREGSYDDSVKNNEVCEFFQTQTQYLNMYPYLCDQTLPSLPQFYYNLMFHDESSKTVTMVTLD